MANSCWDEVKRPHISGDVEEHHNRKKKEGRIKVFFQDHSARRGGFSFLEKMPNARREEGAGLKT